MFLIWITILVFMQNVTDGCSPFGLDAFSASRVSQPMPTLGVSSNPSETLFGHRARGQSTHLGGNGGSSLKLALGTSSNPPIMDATELNCFDFDVHCKWRNMEGLFVDELDWFQGSGILDQGRLQVATGTHISPEGMYAIVATDTVQMSTTKAVLVGDQIACQDGPAELKFKYWTSPEVRIKVCTKKVAKVFPDFDYCSSHIETGDPGPAYVTVPDQGISPFQLYIIADHFVFHAVNLQGGFAIIDDIEYIADMCPDTVMSRAASHNDIVPFSFSPMADGYPTTTEFATLAFPTLGVNTFDETVEKQLEPKQSLKFSPLITRRGPLPNTILTSEELPSLQTELRNACEILTCSFERDQSCVDFANSSSWMVTSNPVGNPLTGIKGDASELPYNKKGGGSFAYISGPVQLSRLVTPPFFLDRDVLFVFSHHKVDRNSFFNVRAKRFDKSRETTLFEAKVISRENLSHRWFREGSELLSGDYEYILFEVRNLTANNYLGIDELMIVDSSRRPFCHTLL